MGAEWSLTEWQWSAGCKVAPYDSTQARFSRMPPDLIRFLETDLDLALMMLQTARIEGKDDTKEVPVVLARVRRAVETVRGFLGRIHDPIVWAEIRRRADELEAMIENRQGTITQVLG